MEAFGLNFDPQYVSLQYYLQDKFFKNLGSSVLSFSTLVVLFQKKDTCHTRVSYWSFSNQLPTHRVIFPWVMTPMFLKQNVRGDNQITKLQITHYPSIVSNTAKKRGTPQWEQISKHKKVPRDTLYTIKNQYPQTYPNLVQIPNNCFAIEIANAIKSRSLHDPKINILLDMMHQWRQWGWLSLLSANLCAS